jgi:group I intron endonuclease
MPVIYRITNMANDKFYIGSAESFERRRWQHVYALKRGEHKNPHLQAAWNKYGEEMFVFEVLETVANSEAVFDAENRYLHQFVGRSDCYNINIDAHKPRLGKTHTPETKAKIRANRIAPTGEAHYRYGKTVAPEVRSKISATQAGRPNPRKGLKMSEQGRANVAAAVKRGEESHFYGKRPTNADDLQKPVYVQKPDGTQEAFPSLSYMRDTLGVSIATIIRACKSGRPVRVGVASGWKMSYEPVQAVTLPPEYADLPRTRQLAKEQGTALYFTGVPCEHGHLAPRKVKGICVECAKIEGQKSNARARLKKLAATQTT